MLFQVLCVLVFYILYMLSHSNFLEEEERVVIFIGLKLTILYVHVHKTNKLFDLPLVFTEMEYRSRDQNSISEEEKQ